MPPLPPGLTHDQQDEVSSLMIRLSEANDETQRSKRAHNQVEKDKASAELALKSLQQKFDQLTKNYEETLEQVKEERRRSSSSREIEQISGTCVCVCFLLFLREMQPKMESCFSLQHYHTYFNLCMSSQCNTIVLLWHNFLW